MKFTTSIAVLGALATSTAQIIIVPLGPVRGPNTLVLKEIGGVVRNECLTFTNDVRTSPPYLPHTKTNTHQGKIVNAACVNTNADRQVAPGKIFGTDILILQRAWQTQFRADLVGKTACLSFNGTTFRAEDCERRDLLFARFDLGSGRIVSNGDPACLSGHNSRAGQVRSGRVRRKQKKKKSVRNEIGRCTVV